MAAALLVAAAGVAGCGGDDDEASGLAADGGAGTTAGVGGGDGPEITLPDEIVAVSGDPAEVTALDNSFADVGISVPAGTTVRWTNRGRQDHDVIPVEGDAWGAEVEQFHPGDTYEYTFTEPGTYNYFCTIHGTAARGMVGVVVVE
jgi:plastocyanin